MASRHTPVSTYRLQITADFDLLEAARPLAYLHDLGVDWVYLSPLLAGRRPAATTATTSSRTDRVDDPARGGAAGLAGARGRGPPPRHGRPRRHRAQPRRHRHPVAEHRWWWDVLAQGQDSVHAAAFDIDWEAGGGRLRLPVLGDDADLGRPARGRRRRAALPRPRASRSPRDRRTGDDPTRSTTGSTTSWSAGDEADRDLTTGGSSRSTPSPPCGSRTGRCSTPPTSRSSGGSTRAWSTGCGSTTPTGCATPAATSTTWPSSPAAPTCWSRRSSSRGEELPTSWATAGTTGYDALALVDRVLIDPAGQAPLDALETGCAASPSTGTQHDPRHQARRRRRHPRLGGAPDRRASWSRPARADSPRTSTPSVDAVAELLACFPVYRSYLPDGPRAPRRGVRRGARAAGPTWTTPLDRARAGARRPGRRRPRSGSSRPAAW